VDPLALEFLAVAAVLHAAWNILLKTAGDPLRTATVGVVAASLALIPAVIAAWLLLDRPAVPAGAWVIGIVSGLVEVAYFVFLASAYRRGDLSVVYPLARGSAPLLAVIVAVTVLGERLPAAAWAGVALLFAGLLVVQRPWNLLRTASARDRSGVAFALLTGAMIAVYSSLDTVGVGLTPAWLYAGILWPVCGAGLLVVAWLRPRMLGGRFTSSDQPLNVGRAVAGGFITFIAYGFVLAALSRAPLAIVAPLRECSG
jgi:drug/metabolite transporter (DMT)-like permease